jgi:hypothetical protein
MTNKNKATAALYGTIIAASTFALFFISIKYVLGAVLFINNIITLAIFSIIVGLISCALFLFKLKIAFSLFVAGIIVGFAFMINTYRTDMAGWGDLIGLITFFMLTAIGLFGGLIIQFIVYLIRKFRNRNAGFKR